LRRVAVVGLDAVAAVVLGLVERLVGAAEQRIKRVVIGQLRRTDAHRHGADIEGKRLDGQAESFRHEPSVAQVRVGKQNRKFVAAPAHRIVGGADHGAHDLR
jgi:hypothetical protein